MSASITNKAPWCHRLLLAIRGSRDDLNRNQLGGDRGLRKFGSNKVSIRPAMFNGMTLIRIPFKSRRVTHRAGMVLARFESVALSSLSFLTPFTRRVRPPSNLKANAPLEHGFNKRSISSPSSLPRVAFWFKTSSLPGWIVPPGAGCNEGRYVVAWISPLVRPKWLTSPLTGSFHPGKTIVVP